MKLLKPVTKYTCDVYRHVHNIEIIVKREPSYHSYGFVGGYKKNSPEGQISNN
jgi:hypothetical protein